MDDFSYQKVKNYIRFYFCLCCEEQSAGPPAQCLPRWPRYPHLTDEQTEPQKGEIICPRSCTQDTVIYSWTPVSWLQPMALVPFAPALPKDICVSRGGGSLLWKKWWDDEEFPLFHSNCPRVPCLGEMRLRGKIKALSTVPWLEFQGHIGNGTSISMELWVSMWERKVLGYPVETPKGSTRFSYLEPNLQQQEGLRIRWSSLRQVPFFTIFLQINYLILCLSFGNRHRETHQRPRSHTARKWHTDSSSGLPVSKGSVNT